MSNRTKVVELRVNNPCWSATHIAGVVGLSRERIRQILRGNGLPTAAVGYGKKTIVEMECNYCHKKFQGHSYALFCSRECRYDYHRVNLVCEVCGVVFSRRYASIRSRYCEGRDTTDHIFCSKRCQGKWLATTYGFGVYPAHSRYGLGRERKE